MKNKCQFLLGNVKPRMKRNNVRELHREQMCQFLLGNVKLKQRFWKVN